MADNLIQCFRLKGTGAENLKVGDEITVTGILKNYNGTVEFDAGCVLKEKSDALAVFDFGLNGDAAHVDGNDLGATATYTEGAYTLSLTGMSKVYGPAYDAKGNSCIKFGTKSVVGTMSFTVGADVNYVIIKVAQYKANATKVNVNGTEYTVDKASDNGEYMEIVVDTTTTKTVTFATVSGSCRAMVNSISFWASLPQNS
jgi:hypothetical protein